MVAHQRQVVDLHLVRFGILGEENGLDDCLGGENLEGGDLLESGDIVNHVPREPHISMVKF